MWCCCCFTVSRCGSRLLAEAHCSALVTAIRRVAGRSQRVSLFGRCLGLLEPVVPPAGESCVCCWDRVSHVSDKNGTELGTLIFWDRSDNLAAARAQR
jgi:hypothetical protein